MGVAPQSEEVVLIPTRTPVADEFALIEMPKKYFFPNIRMYDGTNNPDNHVAMYKQQMLTTTIQKELIEADMCKGFGWTVTGPVL